MTPLVSILIPAHNSERWLPETLASALAQTWHRKEVIVVDDGSRDGTAAVAKAFASQGVKVVTIPNSGASAARNHAFSLSRGDYIQWLDADDLLAESKIEAQLQRAAELSDSSRLLSGPWGSFIHRPERARFRECALWADLSPADWLSRKMEYNLHMQTATWLTHRSLALAAGPWDVRMVVDDDGEYFCRVLSRSSGVSFVPEAKVFYRNTPGPRLSYIGRNRAKIEAMHLSMHLHIETLLALEDSAATRRACLSYLDNWQGTFYPERPDLILDLRKLATKLGGELPPFRFRGKYAWLVSVLGPSRTKYIQLLLPYLKARLLAHLERLLAASLERHRNRRPRQSR